jgi:DNA-binding protein Fis
MQTPNRYLISIASAAVSVTLAHGQNFGPRQTITQMARHAISVYATDLDGDGDPDVVSASLYDGKIAWYKNLTANTFQSRTVDGHRFGRQRRLNTGKLLAQDVFAADLDGDGDGDILSATSKNNTISWYENLGSDKYGPEQVITTAANNPESIFATDLDGDGDADLLSASSYDDKIAWYENMGDGSFGPQQVLTYNADGAECVYATDLDGDGDADVLSASRWGGIDWFKNKGGGNFSSKRFIYNTNGATSIFATDLDGDGDADVIASEGIGDVIGWYENQDGLGTFSNRKIITTAVDSPNAVYATDLDGDGDADLLSASVWDDKIAWYENRLDTPTKDFGPQKVITDKANNATDVYAADIDGDGVTDVLSASAYDKKISWYRNLMGAPTCNVVFCDTDMNNVGDVALSTCNCSGGSINLRLVTPFAKQFTYPLVGLGTSAVSPTGVSELCLAGSTIGRYSLDAGAISAAGTFSIDLLNANSAPGGGVPTIGGALCSGNTWRFQYWHRDGMNPSRFSKGISGLIN